MKDKGKSLRQGGRDTRNDNQIGLLPSQGWQQRNYQFLRNIVIPSMFAQRTGETSSEILLAPSFDNVLWIGHATFLVQIGGRNILVDPNWAMWHGIFKRVHRPGLDLDHRKASGPIPVRFSGSEREVIP